MLLMRPRATECSLSFISCRHRHRMHRSGGNHLQTAKEHPKSLLSHLSTALLFEILHAKKSAWPNYNLMELCGTSPMIQYMH